MLKNQTEPDFDKSTQSQLEKDKPKGSYIWCGDSGERIPFFKAILFKHRHKYVPEYRIGADQILELQEHWGANPDYPERNHKT